MTKQPITQETRQSLINTTGMTLDVLTLAVEQNFKKKAKLPKNDVLKHNLIDFAIHLCYIRLDLLTALRLYLSAKKAHEERFTVKNLNVIMIEGYKRIYGYGRNINESFWISKIKPICDNLPQHLQAEYKELTDEIIQIGQSGVFDKDSRDYAVHYDPNVTKVYDMLVALDAEIALSNTLVFAKLVEKLQKFTTQILLQWCVELKSELNKLQQ
ncbi:MAG: hypothetical protein SNG02_05120 [Rikenellaceae bacterium]